MLTSAFFVTQPCTGDTSDARPQFYGYALSNVHITGSTVERIVNRGLTSTAQSRVQPLHLQRVVAGPRAFPGTDVQYPPRLRLILGISNG